MREFVQQWNVERTKLKLQSASLKNWGWEGVNFMNEGILPALAPVDLDYFTNTRCFPEKTEPNVVTIFELWKTTAYIYCAAERFVGFQNAKRCNVLFFLQLMLLFRSVCHQVSNQADKLDLLAIFILLADVYIIKIFTLYNRFLCISM